MFDNGVGVRNENKLHGTGELERFNVDGDKPNSLNGWMVYRDGLVQSCTFGTWKEGIVYNWFSVDVNTLKKKEMDEMRKAATEAKVAAYKEKALMEKEQKAIASGTCAKIWHESGTHGIKAHPYIVNKEIQPYGIKIESISMALLIPVMSCEGIKSIQRIFPSGRKMFHKNGTISGGYFLVEDDEKECTKTIYITEGYATACSIYEMTKTPVYVCFNAGNIYAVASQIINMNPGYEVVICADNDHSNKENTGELKAVDAGNKTGAKVLFIGDTRYGTDWNDVVYNAGFENASAMFSKSFDEMRGK